MGTGSSKKILSPEAYLPALLISFTKINEFHEHFINNRLNKEELSNLFYTLMENNQYIDGMIVEFKKLLEKANQNLDIKSVIKFILDKLHKELNEFKNIENQIEINVCGLEESKIYTVFNNLYNKNNKSIIQQLFFGEKEIITKCSSCNISQYSFEVIQMFYYDLEKYKREIELKKLFDDFENNYEKVWLCNKCNNNQNAIFKPVIKKLPQIMIICLDKNINNRRIVYYLNTKIHEEEYTLICFITDTNEKNDKLMKYNVFYKENEKWFVYNIADKETRQIEDITNITKNPLIVFYQKKVKYNKIFLGKIYERLSFLFKNMTEVQNLIKNHISDENKFDKYYIVNKNLFNKLSKIFEKEEIYNNDNIIFDKFNQLTDITKLNENEISNIIKLFSERIKVLKQNNFEPEFDEEKEYENGIKYPKEFVLVKEEEFNGLLKDFNLKMDNLKNYLYEVMFGENVLFIKENNKNIYYICYPLLFILNVERIFVFKEENSFSHEIKLYIKDKGGLNYYFNERNLEIFSKVQNIIDKEGEHIGELINVISNKTMFDLNKNYYANRNMNNNNMINNNFNMMNNNNMI